MPFVPHRTSKEEDAQIASLFAQQATDSAAALGETVRLYDASGSETFRSKLVYVLGSFRMPGAVAKLEEVLLRDPSPMIRRDALALIANMRVPEAYAFMKSLLKPQQPHALRQRALLALLQNGAAGMDTLCYRLALDDQDEGIAELAAIGLSRMGPRVDNRVFQNLLQKGKYPGIRRGGFFTLAGLSRHAYSRADLKRISSGDRDPVIRLCARRLAAMQPDTLFIVQAIIDAIGSTAIGGPGSMVWFFTHGFEEPGSGFRDLLLWPACSAPEEHIAMSALQGLRRLLGREGGRSYANVAIFSRFIDVRKAALRQIAEAGAPTPITALDSVLHRDQDAGVRYEAIQALAVQANDSAAVSLLDVAMHDADLSLRGSAISALGRMHSPKAEEALKDLEHQ